MRAIDRNKNVSELQLCPIDSARNLYASHNDIDPASALQNNIYKSYELSGVHTLKTPSVERVNLTLTPLFKSVSKRSSRLISLATDEVTLSLSESAASDILVLKAHPANVPYIFRFPLGSSLVPSDVPKYQEMAFLITVCEYGASIQTTSGALNLAI